MSIKIKRQQKKVTYCWIYMTNSSHLNCAKTLTEIAMNHSLSLLLTKWILNMQLNTRFKDLLSTFLSLQIIITYLLLKNNVVYKRNWKAGAKKQDSVCFDNRLMWCHFCALTCRFHFLFLVINPEHLAMFHYSRNSIGTLVDSPKFIYLGAT